MAEIKRFRQLHSKTPGHPELTHAPSGIETTTGPLGQGVANAVGMAVSAKMAEARFNTKEHVIFDHHIVCLAGDGCMQEGVAMEAVAFAGHQKLDNLILIYDSNAVTLDAMAKESQSEDTAKRFEAIGFDVETIDGHEMEAFAAAFERAKHAGSGKPQLIIAKTLIGKGIPEVEGTQKAHGEAGAKFSEAARKGLGLPPEPYYVSPAVRAFFAGHAKELEATYEAWTKTFDGVEGEEPGARGGAGPSAGLRVHRCLHDTARKTPDTAALLARGAGVPGGHEDRDAQGRTGRAPAARREGAAAHRRKRRPLRFDAELHRRSEGGQRRLQAGASRGPEHSLRNSRARYVLDPQRHRRSRDLPPERRDVPRLRGLLPCRHPPRGAQPLAGHLHLHPRQRRRGRRRPDPRAGRDRFLGSASSRTWT